MIVFDLDCRGCDQRVESWFGSNEDYLEQKAVGRIACPRCGSSNLDKAPMAPALAARRDHGPIASLAEAQAEALRESRWVGDDFANQAREMHAGTRDPERIHGQATVGEARALIDEGVPVLPLPLPVVPPNQLN